MKKLLYGTVAVLVVLFVVWGLTSTTNGIAVQLSEHRYEMNPQLPSILAYMTDAGVSNGLSMAFFTRTGVTGTGLASSAVTGTYATAQMDTFIFNREKGISALAFGIHFKDSVILFRTTAARVLRVVDGVICSLPAADTLTGFTNFTGTADGSTNQPWKNGVSALGTITLAPNADQYWVILKYDTTGNGVTTANYKAEFIKTYSYQ